MINEEYPNVVALLLATRVKTKTSITESRAITSYGRIVMNGHQVRKIFGQEKGSERGSIMNILIDQIVMTIVLPTLYPTF